MSSASMVRDAPQAAPLPMQAKAGGLGGGGAKALLAAFFSRCDSPTHQGEGYRIWRLTAANVLGLHCSRRAASGAPHHEGQSFRRVKVCAAGLHRDADRNRAV